MMVMSAVSPSHNLVPLCSQSFFLFFSPLCRAAIRQTDKERTLLRASFVPKGLADRSSHPAREPSNGHITSASGGRRPSPSRSHHTLFHGRAFGIQPRRFATYSGTTAVSRRTSATAVPACPERPLSGTMDESDSAPHRSPPGFFKSMPAHGATRHGDGCAPVRRLSVDNASRPQSHAVAPMQARENGRARARTA